VNDYLVRPIDCNELVARVRTQLRRKRYADSLRDNVQTAIEMAMINPLTGLNNRRYLESHLATLLDQAAHRGRPLSLMILDIDHFKAVNDTHGHNAGDEILKSFSSRIRKAARTADLVCRLAARNSSSSCRTRRWSSRRGSPSASAARLRLSPFRLASRGNDPGDRLDRPGRWRARRQSGCLVQARGPGALRLAGQRPQPGHSCRGLSAACVGNSPRFL
jgi:hypothetical protein